MRKMRGIGVLLGLMLAGLLASATTVVPMSVERLTQASEHVVLARAVKSWSQWNPEHTMIFTYTRFAVSRSFKGTAPQTIVVKQLGGNAGGYRVRVAGVRYWHSGEEAVLFLRPSEARDGTLVVTGLMQGNFHVDRPAVGEATVSNGMSEVLKYDPSSRAVASFQGSRMRLSELEARVQKAVRQ